MAVGAALEERTNELPETDGPWPLPDGWCWTSMNAVAAINPPTNFDAPLISQCETMASVKAAT
jgi:hypothetical protein